MVSSKRVLGRCKSVFVALACSLLLVSLIAPAGWTQIVFLDADTPATGSMLRSIPLITPYGSISFTGEIIGRATDPEFNAAGASGDVFDILPGGQWAKFDFGFDVESCSFIYGGNMGGIKIEALDINGSVLASFYQVSTDAGQPAGPATLVGAGIRELRWKDTDASMQFAPLDNISLRVAQQQDIPELPAALMALPGFGALRLMWRRRRS